MNLHARSAIPVSSVARVEADPVAVAIEPQQLDRNPVAVYLSSLSPPAAISISASGRGERPAAH